MIRRARAALGPILQHESLLMITVSTALVMMGQGVIAPVLPLLQQKFDVGAAAIGLTLTSFGLARLLLNVPMGIVADRYGRRLLLVTGPLIGGIGMIGSGFAGTLVELLMWRLVAGAGSAIYATGAQVFLADVSTRETRGRYLGTNQGALLLGTSFGPAIGGVAADAWGLAAPFVIVGVASLVAAIYAYARLPETKHLAMAERAPVPPTGPRPQRAWLTFLRSRDFLLVSIVNASIFFTRAGGRQAILPLLGAAKFGLSTGALGWIFTAMALMNMALVLPAGALADRFGRKWTIVPSGVLVGLAMCVIAVADSYSLFLAGALAYGVASSLAGPAPAAYAVDIAPPGLRGLGMGMFRSSGDIGFLVGPPLLGYIADHSTFGWALIVDGGVMIGASLAFLLAHETTGARHPAPVEAARR